jgi:CRP/FNR family transcriptional regulator, cyclic AMP receptor protein
MDTREEIGWLKSLALFHHLSEAKLEELARYLDSQRVPAGDLIFEEGDRGDTMFLIAEGRVRIDKRVEAGEFQELVLFSPGDSFGEMSLIEEAPRSARAVAVTDATLFVLGREDLKQWLNSDPLMAVGFFVELLRLFSHRLRGTLENLVLLHDLSHVTVRKYENEVVFLQAVLRHILPHLRGDWCCAAYFYNEYNQELSRVGSEGRQGEALPDTLPLTETASRWLDPGTFCVCLPGEADAPLGFLVVRNQNEMAPREKAELEVTLTAAAHLLSSALQNIKHDTEERLRARLEFQRLQESHF